MKIQIEFIIETQISKIETRVECVTTDLLQRILCEFAYHTDLDVQLLLLQSVVAMLITLQRHTAKGQKLFFL
jgi:hypothetical protein